jgi:hypothetical protein
VSDVASTSSSRRLARCPSYRRNRVSPSHVRMSFAAFQPRKHWLNGHLVLAREAEHPLFRSVQVFSPRNVLHEFRIDHPEQIDASFLALCREAYEAGEQRHLSS